MTKENPIVDNPVVEEVDNQVPPVPVVEDPLPVVEDPPKPVEQSDPDWKGPLQELTETVNGIAATLEKVINPGSNTDVVEVATDEAPVKKPWTHKPLFGGR